MTFEELQKADPDLAKFLEHEVEVAPSDADRQEKGNFHSRQVLRLEVMEGFLEECPKRRSAVRRMILSAADRHDYDVYLGCMEQLLEEFNSKTQATRHQQLVLHVPNGAAVASWRMPARQEPSLTNR